MSIYLHKVKSRWQPGENTLAYYPLNSTSTVNDMKTSWTKYNLTNYNILFGTYQWVDCAYFNSANSRSWLYYSWTQIIPSWDFTWNVWMYLISTSTDNPRLCSSYVWWNNYWVLLNSSWNIVVWSTSSTTWIPTTTGWWHLYTVVWNFSQWSYKWYVDWVLSNTWSWTWISSWTWLNIWWFDNAWSWSATSDKLNWYLSERILENKKWSDDDVMDYYMLTKWDYHTETQWEVNQNTMLYMPMDWDAENKVDWTLWTWSWTETYYTLSNWINVAHSNSSHYLLTPTVANSTPLTVSCWIYRNSWDQIVRADSNSWTRSFPQIWTGNNVWWVRFHYSWTWYWWDVTIENWWHNIIWVFWTNWIVWYIDWHKICESSFNSYLWRTQQRWIWYDQFVRNVPWDWYYSNLIIESKEWSADEALSYYYQTRNDYVDDPWYPVKEYEVQNIYIGRPGWTRPSTLKWWFWKLNGNMDDSTNNWHNGSWNSSYTTDRNGTANWAYNASSTSYYVSIPNSSDLYMTSWENFSFWFWIKPSYWIWTGSTYWVISMTQNVDSYPWRSIHNDSVSKNWQIRIHANWSWGAWWQLSNLSWSANEWFHFVVTCDWTTIKYYKNWELLWDVSYTSWDCSTSYPLTIWYASTWNASWYATYDDVFYMKDYCLSGAEISSIYNYWILL